jgi:alpha-L-fucosidase 2
MIFSARKLSLLGVAFICFCMALSRAEVQVSAQLKQTQDVLWDDQPAKDWMTEAYPIGNGRIGAMVFGGTQQERIQFNDNTLWTGDETERGTYQAFGELFIDFDQADAAVSNYKRTLDLSQSVHTINYTQNNTEYRREYFSSFPDKVIVLRFTASKKGAYSGTIRLKDEHGSLVKAANHALYFSGKLSNGMPYQANAFVKVDNGSYQTLTDKERALTLKVTKADAITIYLVAATNYSNRRADGWKGEEPATKIDRILKQAKAKSYTKLLADHIRDYQQLYGRVKLTLGEPTIAQNALPTKSRVTNYKLKGDPGLEALLFQYGRYLLISSSRKGGLPANLQGLWNNSNNPPWGSDYHSNINVQMNYWLAEPTNLSECHVPYLDYINSIREVAKIHTQQEYGRVRGWTVKTENNIFGGDSFLWNTPGSAWYAQALWDHYTFTRDKERGS